MISSSAIVDQESLSGQSASSRKSILQEAARVQIREGQSPRWWVGYLTVSMEVKYPVVARALGVVNIMVRIQI